MLGSMVTHYLATHCDFEVSATVRSGELLAQSRRWLPEVNWKTFAVERDRMAEALRVVEGPDCVINATGITKPLID